MVKVNEMGNSTAIINDQIDSEGFFIGIVKLSYSMKNINFQNLTRKIEVRVQIRRICHSIVIIWFYTAGLSDSILLNFSRIKIIMANTKQTKLTQIHSWNMVWHNILIIVDICSVIRGLPKKAHKHPWYITLKTSNSVYSYVDVCSLEPCLYNVIHAQPI